MSRLARLFPPTEARDWAGPWGPSDGTIPGPADADGIAGAGGLPISERTALQLIDAYACVTLLADAVSMLPIDHYTKVKGGHRTEVATPSPLVTRPDPEIERWDFVSRLVTSLALRGDAYAAVLSTNSAGWPTGLRAVHPNDVNPYRASNGAKRFKLRDGPDLDASELIHIPLITLPGALTGLSPIQCAQRGIRLAIQTEQFGDRWFAEGASPSSVLESDVAVDDDEATRNVARWVASHGGRRRPAFLSGGLKWKAITITPNESQFLESRKLNTSQIARIWRIAPHLIGDVEKNTSWGTGIEEQGIGFVTFTLGPYLNRIEAALTRLMPAPEYAKFNVGALLRGNTKDRYFSYAIARQWGWLSVNDIRRLEDEPPVPGGDTYLQPLNMVDASGTGSDEMSIEQLTQALQKIYLAVGVVITAEEARLILNKGGAGLAPGPLPVDPTPAPPAPVPSED